MNNEVNDKIIKEWIELRDLFWYAKDNVSQNCECISCKVLLSMKISK